MPTKYDDKNASKDTGDSTSKVNEAWHGARDDSGVQDGASGAEPLTYEQQAVVQGIEIEHGLLQDRSSK